MGYLLVIWWCISYFCVKNSNIFIGQIHLKSYLEHFGYFTFSVPSHYLSQCWLIVDWTFKKKILWNSNQNLTISMKENQSENAVCKMVTILSRLNILCYTVFIPYKHFLMPFAPTSSNLSLFLESIIHIIIQAWYSSAVGLEYICVTVHASYIPIKCE